MPIDYSDLRWPKGTPRIVDRIAKRRQRAQQERLVRKDVKKRDEGRCRACGRYGAQLHHLERRSAGGPWTAGNVVLLCLLCHQFAHAALLHFTGNPEPGHLFTVTSQGAAAAHLARGPAWR